MTGHRKTTAQLVELYDTIMPLLNLFNNDYGAEVILFYGSLLGYHRDGNFIHGDDDIDVIVPRTYRERLIHYIQANKPETIRITLNEPDILQLRTNLTGPFDIYFYDEPVNSKDICIRWDGNLLFKRCDIFPTRSVVFNGHTIHIPNNPGAILLELYGLEWCIPKVKNVDYVWERVTTVRRLTTLREKNVVFNLKL